ncbi:MAG: class I SAM-dependent methyltransferase [Paludibacter sp.]
MTNGQRLKAIYSILRKILIKPSSIFLVLKDETEYESYLLKKYRKIQLPTVDINNFLQNGTTEVNHFTFLDGSSLLTDLALLKSVAASYKKCDYMEIGTWRGESILNVADTGANCTSVNLSPEDIIAMGMNEKYAHLHGCLIPDENNIKSVYANSLTFDFGSLNQKYDLIFVDGDHSYEAVKSDSAKVYELLKDDNSMIIWHDYGYNPETPRHSVIAAILDGLPDEAHQYLYHVSNTICAVFTHRNLKSIVLESPVEPDKVFSIQLKNIPFKH